MSLEKEYKILNKKIGCVQHFALSGLLKSTTSDHDIDYKPCIDRIYTR